MLPAETKNLVSESDLYESRLEFLYKAVEDTQNTIRFLDTKAAFSVTLLSGMAAVVLQSKHAGQGVLPVAALSLFIVFTSLTLFFCMRVIFPVLKPPSDHSLHTTRTIPKFYVSHHRTHHWLRHTLTNDANDVLCEDRGSYTASLMGASDNDLLVAMCDELLMVSLVRQIKADRLKTVQYTLAAAILLFAVNLFV